MVALIFMMMLSWKIIEKINPSPSIVQKIFKKDDEPVNLGLILVKNKKYAEAVEVFDDVIKKSPDLIIKIRKDYSDALTVLGEKKMAKDLSIAMKYFEKSLLINPENSRTCFLLGKIHTVLKNNKKALSYYNMAVSLDPENPDIYFNMGYSYASVDNYEKAKEMYNKVIARSPSFIDQAYFNLGLIEFKSGQKREAYYHMRKALEANPLNTNAERFLESKK